MDVAWVVVSAFAIGGLAPLVVRVAGRAAGWLLALHPLLVTAWLVRHVPHVASGGSVHSERAWVPGLDVSFSFHLDGLALLFALLVTGIGTLVLVYAASYLAGHPRLGRFYGLLLAFMGAMLGLVLADDVFLVFVFWELTSVTSWLLVGFEGHRADARHGAMHALYVTASGGLAFLAGLVLLSAVTGTASLAALPAHAEVVRAHAAYVPIVVLVALGAFTKSAQWPFHFWLPGVMVAPTPVSAYLHSATMVKAGVYLLLRFTPVLGGTRSWLLLLVGVGLATMLVGAWIALRKSDYKLILAYSTVSTLGTLVLLVGLGTTEAVEAVIVVVLAHALYKGALFMVAGAVEHATGTRDVDHLGGLGRRMPVTAFAAALAALALAGFVPLFSFIGKELTLEAVLGAHVARPVVASATIASAMLLVAVAFVVGLKPFTGARRVTPRVPYEAGPGFLLGPLVLGVAGVLLGVMPNVVDAWLMPGAVEAVTGAPPARELRLWHGFTPTLVVSAFIVVGGYALYKGWINVHDIPGALARAARFGPARLYEAGFVGLHRFARALTARLQPGRLRVYVGVVLASLVALLAAAIAAGGPALDAPRPDVRAHELVLGVLVASAAILVATTRSRVTALVALGVVGYGAALAYAYFGAPDLAMTQFLFETLTVVLFAFLLPHLPRLGAPGRPRARGRDALVAGVAGVVMALLVLQVTSMAPVDEPASTFHVQESVPAAHGRNVVNVILVDFRALDTLGEVTVLAVAGIGVAALLQGARERRRRARA